MIIFLYGADSYRSRQKLNEFKDKYRREVDKLGSGLVTIAGAKSNLAEIAAAAGPASLLSKKRLIVIEEIFSNKDQAFYEQTAEYFKKQKSSDNIVIFWESGLKMKKVKNALTPMLTDSSGKDKPLNKAQAELFKFLSKQKYAFAFNLLSNAEAAAWARKLAAARGGKIGAKAAELLVALTGVDGWQISGELDKLINYKAAGSLITAAEIEAEDVKNLVRGNFSENIFALTDALSRRDKQAAAGLLAEQLEAGLSEGYILNMLVRQFKILLSLRQSLDLGLSQRQIASRLKLHPFVMQKGLSQAANFTLAALKKIFARLSKIDFEVKSGQDDYLNGLNRLIAEI